MDNSKLEQMPFLEGDTIYLRALCETDAESDYPSWFNSSKVCQYNSHHRFPYTKEDSIAFIRKLADDRSRIIFAIVDKKTYKHIVKSSRECSLFFWGPVNINNIYRIQLKTGILKNHSFCERLGTSITHTHTHTHTHCDAGCCRKFLARNQISLSPLHLRTKPQLSFSSSFFKRNFTQRSSFCSVLSLQSVNWMRGQNIRYGVLPSMST